jgi:hypothetical protein
VGYRVRVAVMYKVSMYKYVNTKKIGNNKDVDNARLKLSKSSIAINLYWLLVPEPLTTLRCKYKLGAIYIILN